MLPAAIFGLNRRARSCEWAREAQRISWRRPTLPGGYPPSTIGAVRLNGRVRDGTGCTPDAQATNRPGRPELEAHSATPRAGGRVKRQVLRTTWKALDH